MSLKNKTYLNISSAGAALLVEFSDRALAEKIRTDDFLKKYIPDPVVREGRVSGPDCSLKISRGPRFSVKLAYPSVDCVQPRRVDVRGLISLMGYLLERARAEKNVHSLHSSVVVKGGKAVVLFGGTTNLGKTSVAKAAGKVGWSFYSDEVALIWSGRVIGGARVATNSDRFKDFILSADHGKYPIAVFVHPHIDNGLSEVVKWQKNKFLWHLKEELARKLRGGSKAVNFSSYPLESLDTFAIASARLKLARRLADRVPCYEVRGTPEQIAERIAKLKLRPAGN
ncbi:MAG: hypothetical protein Q8L24_02830 [bacterium]|nr:hypothetical protein [bacterium]